MPLLRSKPKTTEYLLSPDQVRRVRNWLKPWADCPWCGRPLLHWDADLKHATPTPDNHTPKCLFALITQERP